MKKRIYYYLIHTIVLLCIIYLSFFLYFFDFSRTNKFLLKRIGNVTLIFVLLMFLLNIFGLFIYKQMGVVEFNFFKELFSILGKVFIVILIVSFAEFFIFYKTKVGRIVYFNLFILLSLFFVVERSVKERILQKKSITVLWLSKYPFEVIKDEYLRNISHNRIFVSDDIDKVNLTVYDYPPKNGVNVSKLLPKIISSKNPIDLITYIEENAECIPLKYVDELWLLKNIRTYENAYDKLRRIINIIFSLILLALLFLPSFLVAVLHRFTSKGPIFFIQERIGYKGKPFRLIKYRTMIHNAEANGPQFASKDDPRITKVGKFMRMFRIDEVPQLFNILKGDMNLIGPRPERREFIDKLEKEIPYYKLRLEVRPGLTGWAQVNYPYAGDNIEDHIRKLEYDLYYIKNRGLALDILILFKTVKTVLMRRGT